jgi:hypothetical protein
MDALGGLAGGVAGEVGDVALKGAFKSLKTSIGSAGKYTFAKGVGRAAPKTLKATAMSSLRGSARAFLPGQATSQGMAGVIDLFSNDESESQSQQRFQGL